MTKINLSPEELETIQQCINDNVEIPLEIMQKLNPPFFDKLAEDSRFDFEKLNRYKIPTIEYAGKRSESTILASATLLGQSSPLQVERLFEGGKMKTDGELQLELYSDKNTDGTMDVEESDQWVNMIIQGDNLQFLKSCYLNQDPLVKDKVKGKVKLIYIDPPFATKSDFGGNEGEFSYTDKIERAEFLEALRERFIFLRELLADDGSIYIHCDWRLNSYIRILLDEIFGADNLLNEIVWKRRMSKTSPDANRIENIVDYIFWYSKGAKKIFNRQFSQSGADEYIQKSFTKTDAQGRRYQSTALNAPAYRPTLRYEFMGFKPPEKGWSVTKDVMQKYYDEGKLILPKSKEGRIRRKQYLDEWLGYEVNSLWTDIPVIASQAGERLAYPTQKPEALLERIILTSTNEGDLVLDCFAGSGTAGAVAEKLGRKWIMCDFGKHAIYTMQKRLLTIKDSKGLGENTKANFGKLSRPFCIASVGAFDFSMVIDLRQHKGAYLNFVLELNGIHERDTSKFSLPNIYGVKEGNPVEVYPIWDDEYLKNIKIDQDYLNGIIQSTGGKLKGDYYIIAPEICDVVGDTSLKNQNGETVNFKLLTFPYKILEEVSRHYQLSEQPSDDGDINNLISSTRFYFNEEVTFQAEFNGNEIKINKFETNATDKDGNKFTNLDGLAMVLIDKNWDGNLFTMEEAVYLKNIPHDPAKADYGVIKLSELTNKVALIAIDKHGNESKIVVIEK